MWADRLFRYKLYRWPAILPFVDTLGPWLLLAKRTELGLLLRVGQYGIFILGIP